MTVLTARDLESPYPYVVSEGLVRDVTRLLCTIPHTTSASSLVSLGWDCQSTIMRLEGLGGEIWSGVDAKQYIDELRNDWNDR